MNAPSRIRIGAPPDPEAPPQDLDAAELTELRRLLDARRDALERVQLVENQVQLLLLVARDRRGLSGPVDVDPETGRLEMANGVHGVQRA